MNKKKDITILYVGSINDFTEYCSPISSLRLIVNKSTVDAIKFLKEDSGVSLVIYEAEFNKNHIISKYKI